MEVVYKTNGSYTTASMTEWYFGKKTVESLTASALRMHKTSGNRIFKFWQDGTGYLTVEIH